MNHAVVTDARVALKWVLPDEEWATQAEAMLRRAHDSGQLIIAPAHLFSEVTNALHQRARSRPLPFRITPAEAEQALARFLAVPIEIVSFPALYQQALSFAQAASLPSLYDSLYVVLAEVVNTELWTADRRLVRALGDSAPWVRFIGDYPLYV